MAFMFYEIYTYNCKYKIKIPEHGSNLWLWICCRQLPLPHCIATTKQFTGLFCLRQITAALRFCDAMSQVRELCRGADRNKKTAHRAIFFVGASNRARTCDTAVNSRVLCQLSYWGIFGFISLYQVIEPVTGLKHSRLARLERFAILLVSSYSTDQLFVHRTVDPSRQLTAACSANWAIEAYSDNKYYPVVRWIMSFVLFFLCYK